MAGAARSKNGIKVAIASVWCGAGTAELAAESTARSRTGEAWTQVSSIEEVEEFDSELGSVPFLYPPKLAH